METRMDDLCVLGGFQDGTRNGKKVLGGALKGLDLCRSTSDTLRGYDIDVSACIDITCNRELRGPDGKFCITIFQCYVQCYSATEYPSSESEYISFLPLREKTG